MATLCSLSLNMTDCSVTTSVANDDIARLMYYLHCVTVGVGLDILQDDLVRHQNYRSLSPTRIALVIQTAADLSPDIFVDKLIFRDDDHEVLERGERNKFVRISAACDIVSLQSDIFLMGKVRNATQVMFFDSSWLDSNYMQPIQRIVRTLLGTKHCSHCEGADGLCTCTSCPRTAESKCSNIIDAFLDVFNAIPPQSSLSANPRPSTPQLLPVETPRHGEHQCNCDGCGWRLFTGARYKCTTCYDYDLCEQCYESNKHDMGHPFNQYHTPGGRPTLLAAQAISKPFLPRTKPDTTVNHPPPRYSEEPTTRPSSSPFFYDTMSASELKQFLNDHGATFDDILDKETLCRRVWDTFCESMGIIDLNKFLSENSISTADCRDIESRRRKAKDMFRSPKRPEPPLASANTSQVRWRKDDDVILKGLNWAEMNGKRGTVMLVDNALGRVQVRIEGMDKSFKVKFENLQMATNEEEDEELD